MDKSHDVAHSTARLEIGRARLCAAKIFDGTKLPSVVEPFQNHYRWYKITWQYIPSFNLSLSGARYLDSVRLVSYTLCYLKTLKRAAVFSLLAGVMLTFWNNTIEPLCLARRPQHKLSPGLRRTTIRGASQGAIANNAA